MKCDSYCHTLKTNSDILKKVISAFIKEIRFSKILLKNGLNIK